MKETNMVILISIISLVLVASASAYVYVTSQEKVNPEDINLKLNESGKMIKISSVAEYNKIIKPGKMETSSPVTATQLTNRLYEIFKCVFKDAEITVESAGPYRLENGSLAHVSIVTVETSKGINTYIYLIDANHLPENTAKDKISLTNTFEEYVCVMEKSNGESKISQDEILKTAKQVYSSHFTPQGNDKYDIKLLKLEDNSYIYFVNVNDRKEIMEFDGDTGELISDYYEPEKTEAQIYTRDECQQKAQEVLNSKGYSYAENLSIEYASVEEDDNSTNYTFNIILEHDGQSEVIGSIKIDAYTLDVLYYNINEPTIEEETDTSVKGTQENNVEEDNSYYDEGYSSSSRSSSSSSSGSSSSSQSYSNNEYDSYSGSNSYSGSYHRGSNSSN